MTVSSGADRANQPPPLSVFDVVERAAALCDRIQGALGYGNVAKTCADQIRGMPVSENDTPSGVRDRAARVCQQIQSELGFGKTAGFCAEQILEAPLLLAKTSLEDRFSMPVVRPEFRFSEESRQKIEAAFEKAIANSPVLLAHFGRDRSGPGEDL